MIAAGGSVRLAAKAAPPPTPVVEPAPAEEYEIESVKPRLGTSSAGKTEAFTGGTGVWTPDVSGSQTQVTATPPLPGQTASLEGLLPPTASPPPPQPLAVSESMDLLGVEPMIPAPPIPHLPPPLAEFDRPVARAVEKPFEVSAPSAPPPSFSDRTSPGAPDTASMLRAVAVEPPMPRPVPEPAVAAAPLPKHPTPVPARMVTRPVMTPGLVVVERNAPERVKAPVVVIPTPVERAVADELSSAGESWKVSTGAEALHPESHGGRHDRAFPEDGGRAGTVPLDARVFRRVAHKSRRIPIAIAASVLVLAGGGLWAAGLVRVGGLPQPPWKSGSSAALGPVPTTPIKTVVARADPIPEPPTEHRAIAPPSATPDAPPPDVRTHDTTPTVEPVVDSGSDNPDTTPAPEMKAKGGHRPAKAVPTKAAPLPAPATSTKPPPTPTPTPIPAPVKPPPVVPTKVAPPPPVPAPTPTPTPAPAVAAVATGSVADLHYQQGNLYLKEKKVALAIEEFKKCLDADPSYGVAYRSLGVAYMLLGREKSAIESYEKFITVAAAHRDAPKVKQIIDDYYRRNPK